ncbi:HTH-type transcriptional regulator FrlR [Pigmentiphaga humi]|uniref:HTH-type transcriptional regulator FrlR n=1 Tax=Pigmentiphaga humi TaxID=2478468 RepID=A0A3P4AZ28_9BURK|nr:GntR family transcriptional regulator [Pigmentiphaga humi]VCU69293.1 HTH-type transcriptional regulator FrlR [Pigmentiphaga humi]
MFQRSAGSQYKLLAQTLIRRIRDGIYPAGGLLPTEHELGKQFNVSRITVRGALRELEMQGLVSRRPGIGTRVESTQPTGDFVHVGNTVDDILRFTRGFTFHTLAIKEVDGNEPSARALRLPPAQRFIRVTGLRRAEGAPPVVYSEHHVPPLYAEALDAMDGYRASVAELLAERRGDRVCEIRQEIDAVRLTRAQAALLETAPSTPTLRTRTWYYGNKKDLIVASVTLFPEGRHLFTTVMRREPTV